MPFVLTVAAIARVIIGAITLLTLPISIPVICGGMMSLSLGVAAYCQALLINKRDRAIAELTYATQIKDESPEASLKWMKRSATQGCYAEASTPSHIN